jgi:hypothetical protein
MDNSTPFQVETTSFKKGALFYFIMVGLFSAGVYFVISSGQKLENHSWTQITNTSKTTTQPLSVSLHSPISKEIIDETHKRVGKKNNKKLTHWRWW